MKKMWKENRVLAVLLLILLVCFIAIICVALTFFYSKNTSTYGDRLENIEKYPITETIKSTYEEELKKNTSVTNVSIKLIGRILYIHIEFDEKITLEKAQDLATKSLDVFEEDYINYYDIQVVLKSSNFTIIGAKNSVVDHISWNNNREVEEETDEES